jgi:hypothetical protein
MGYTPTIAECRLAAVEISQLTRQSAVKSNAESSNTVVEEIQYGLEADLTTAFTNGKLRGKKLKYVSFISPLVANYTANIGDECVVLKVDTSVSASAPYDAELWIYKRFGWEKVLTGGGSTSGAAGAYNTYTGTSVKVNEVRANFSTNSCDNFVAYFRGHAQGTSQMMGVVRGYAHSEGNNSSICGGDFTGALDYGTHSNGHVSGVHAMAEVKSGLTVASGALSALLLTAGLNSACTNLQHGGAAFIFLTDQHATNKVKYLLDTGSDGSSMIDSGSGTSHLECYESNGMTFTCYGGYRIYCGAAAGDMYIPFGSLAS